MKLVLAILSDIHFADDGTNPIPGRSDSIFAAIASAEVMPDGFVLLFTGDLANKGQKGEYELADQLARNLKELINARFPSVEIFRISVPGNHDLYLPEGSDAFRKKVIDGCGESMLQPDKNSFYLEKLLDPQDNYWEFTKRFDYHPAEVTSKICGTFTVNLKGERVRFNLLNSALLSQKRETQGSLTLPLSLAYEVLDKSSPDLTITVMHHPIFWIESNTLTDLRNLFARTTEYVITGHQHFSSVFDVKTELGDSIRYYESPALYDPLRPRSSGFRVLVFDLTKRLEKQMLFTWDVSLYRARRTSEFGWKDIAYSRQLRHSMMMNPEAIQFLKDPGFASPRSKTRPITLQEIFVYPDLKIQKDLAAKQAEIKKGHELVRFLSHGGIKELHGAPLSGKTTLSKALALDIRNHGNATTVWIDGKSLDCRGPDDFEKYLYKAFRQMYSPDQLEPYLQLPPDQRCVIIDDWHLAQISTSARTQIYEWLSAFANASVLMTDETYQFKELLAKGQATKALSDPSVNAIVHCQIIRLSKVTQASLIHKYMTVGRETEDLIEESDELLKTEKLVSELLGKDWLPVFPFFVLGVLQVIETKRTAAIAGGSHGPLYQAIIYSALLRGNPDDPQIPNKIVFLQEVAYRMWSDRTPVISRSDIESVVEQFYESSYLRLPTAQFLQSLTEARLLTRSDGNYTFAYPQYYYYFVALSLSERMDDPGAVALRSQVDSMIDEISSVENAAIVMLLIYLDKDKNHIIDRILKNTKEIYKSVVPARMEVDAADFADLRTVQLNLELNNQPDVVEMRQQARLLRDEQEERRLLNPKAELEANRFAAYSYSEDLPEGSKLHLVSQSIKILGQVIRNFPHRTGPQKVEVLRETYLLGLRAVARVMEVFKGARTNLDKFKPPENVEMSYLEFKRSLDELFTVLMQAYVVVICQSISDNAGVANMDKAYIETAEQLGRTIAIRFIDLTVQLNHFEGIPEVVIRDLHDDLRGNAFSSQILDMIVVSHLMLHKVDPDTFDRVRRALGMNRKEFPMPKGTDVR